MSGLFLFCRFLSASRYILSIGRYNLRIADINFMYRIEVKIVNAISCTETKFPTFLIQKGDFIIFPCNNSMVTFTVKEYKRSVIDEFS
ncbi:hypothetical protein QRE62_19505 [Bacillus mycoides]|uniref:Uncharacterized protein n=1 Tax=Bacillus mycoides TaxID=1405 RepID=A0A3D9VDL2_BACMY|nr:MULTISPECIES: hypothetical protein [Bacillus]MBJ7956997.1 hypothetical protein [Bacillus cereus group sp. N28]MDI6531152.1 hypothetical protein [Bacillus mycoides]RAN67726.1 hypothetical protein B5P40_22125 [Bacillus sp. SRB_8]RAN85154.1 hypothetical protein B5P42_02085 [Bacillus sp. SRB_331]RBP30195.1 hypothetical protein DET63_102104 [Bacillus sp. DB-2]